jgi:hypothetical protein
MRKPGPGSESLLGMHQQQGPSNAQPQERLKAEDRATDRRGVDALAKATGKSPNS